MLKQCQLLEGSGGAGEKMSARKMLPNSGNYFLDETLKGSGPYTPPPPAFMLCYYLFIYVFNY